jgi:predicted Ser/Thr protein kinase
MTPHVAQACGKCGMPAVRPDQPFCSGCGNPLSGTQRFALVRQLFDQGLSIAPSQRDGWLQQACGGDAALFTELRQMFAAASQPTTPAPPGGVPGTGNPSPAPSSYFIGPYRLVRELGRGGMGVVYLALRDDGAFRKQVALKLLLRDMVNDEFIQRFKQERQVLAALDHPNIARILDGGDAPDGMPYYVMEYVEGLPLDKFCDERRLSLTARIRVFQQVCQSVQYLHQNSILHRDLKPSNILVTNDGIVKLLDFGIAKLVGAASIATPDLTTAAGRPMTPIYASPEQITGATPHIPSDIYSLGVILYNLLTGRSPYQGVDEKMAKIVTHQDPPPPSANIREDLRAEETTAQLRRAMLGELDSIVLMAMRIDPRQRYQSALDLSNDLERFLTNQPVAAHHASAAGRSMKFLRRQRLAVGLAAGFVLLTGFAGWQLWRVESQKMEASARETQLRALLDQLEARLITNPAGADVSQERTKDVQALRAALEGDFLKVAAGRPDTARPLLERSVQYLDRLQSTVPANGNLGNEVGAAYQQVGTLVEATSGSTPAGKTTAINVYQKASIVLTGVAAASPGDAAAKERLLSVNQRIEILGGTPAPAGSTPAPEAESSTVRVDAQPQKPPPSAIPTGKPGNVTPPPPVVAAPRNPEPPQRPAAASISAAEANEIRERLVEVSTKIQVAETSIEPIRQNLALRGQTLAPDTVAAMSRMRTSLERATREVNAGDYASAKESLDAADAFAARVLRAVGR